MRHIYPKELSTPEAFVMNRLADSIGLNIRPQKAIFDDVKRIYTVPLKGMIPSQVTNRDKALKTFLYQFEDLGEFQLKRDGDTFIVIDFPRAPEIDEKLHNKWYDLTTELEQEILKVGVSIWGELTYVKMLLRPMYSIILNTLANEKISLSDIHRDKSYLNHVRFLESQKYLEFDQDAESYRPSNLLIGLSQNYYTSLNEGSSFHIASKIVGGIFATHYRQIKTELHAHSPSVYVDTSMAYYLDAIRSGESIQMTKEQLWRKYRMIGHKRTTQEVSRGYTTVISEIILGKLLNRNEDGYIFANESVFSKLQPLGDKLIEQLAEIP